MNSYALYHHHARPHALYHHHHASILFLSIYSALIAVKRLDDDGHEGLRLSRSEIKRLRRLEMKKLLSQNKLHLVLDIDNTLLHAFLPEAFPKQGVLDESVEGYFVKLRPGVQYFLEKANSMFEMYLYTLGNRPYAMDIGKLLDPQGKYFGHRIITCDDIPNMAKTLDLLLGEESCVLIVDDGKQVWQKHDQNNLINTKRYLFTENKATDETDTNAPLMEEIMRDLSRIHEAYFNDPFCRKEKDVRELAKNVDETMNNVKDSKLWMMATKLGAICALQ